MTAARGLNRDNYQLSHLWCWTLWCTM